MTIIRMLWALFLAGFVAYAFRRTWRWEHGTPMPETMFGGDKPRTKETAVWLDPSFLPILLLIILIFFGITDGISGVKRFMSLSLDVMIMISIYFLLLIFMLPVFRRYFSARACATMWVLPVFLFWQAHILLQNAPIPAFVIYIPSNILNTLFLIWAIGFVVVFTGKFVLHFIFRHKVMSAATLVSDPKLLELFDKELKNLEYYHPVKLMISSAVSVPLSMGSRKRTRVTVLPNREFTHQELQFIFRHEIHHLQRGDVNNKVFFAFCQALCWFNPLIWIATRKASDDLELSCDEIVLEEMDEGMRRQYAELLLDSAGHSRGFTTCLSSAAETMRYRLKNVVSVRKRFPGTIMLAIAMFLCVMAYGTIAVSSEKGTVAELIMKNQIDVSSINVYYQPEDNDQFSKVLSKDNEKLFSYLTSLDIEKLSSANEIHNVGGQKLSLQIDNQGLMQIEIYDRLIEVFRFSNGGSTEYFYLRNEPDWDVIKGCLDFDAEEPITAPVLRDLQMHVHFDAAEQNDPITAVRRRFSAWDIETGETLHSSSNSDQPSSLHGLRSPQAQLVFDLPVTDITVWMKEWNSASQATIPVDFENGCYFMTLEYDSAHYQVDVIYEPYEGIQYEAIYVFDVEYPN